MKITFWYGVSIVITLLAAAYGTSKPFHIFVGFALFWLLAAVLAGAKGLLVKAFGKTVEISKDTAWIASIIGIIAIINYTWQ